MNLEQLKEFVPPELLVAIKKLELPGLVFHEDHQETSESLALMQVCETFFATAYECLTGTVGERLVQVPSRRVMQSITTPTTFKENVLDFFKKDIPDEGIFCLNTRPTYPTRLQEVKLHELKLGSEFLQKKLRAVPPGGGFVMGYLQRQLLGPKCGKLEDSVKFWGRFKAMTTAITSRARRKSWQKEPLLF
jgi:hypothetical protein